MEGPGLNAVGPDMHRELADVWQVVDRDPDVRVALIQGAGKGFSAGGSFDLLDQMVGDYAMRTRVMREARDLVYNVINCSKPIVSAIHGPAVGAGLVVGMLADISVVGSLRPHHRRPHPPRRRRGRPCRHLLAAPVRHGQGEVLPAHLPRPRRRGGRAHRARVALRRRRRGCSTPRFEIATELANGAQSAIRWTKQSLNNWYRMLGPAFDASVGLEFYGFGGPDAAEGLAALREKRTAEFRGPTSE